MKSKRLVFWGLIFLSGIIQAQTDFRSGFIVNLSGDTLYGAVDYRGDLLMGSNCKFKSSEGEINNFSPSNIDAYRFTDGRYFISKTIAGRKVFLECLFKGAVSIYYLRDDTGDHYYIDKKNMPLTEIPYKEGIRYINNKRMYFASKNHIGILSIYMQDAPLLKNRIDGMKEPGEDNLIKLAEDYNNIVAKDEKYFIYKKKYPLIGISVEPFLGFIKYPGYDKFRVEAGSYIYINAPRTNEKLYFKTGIIYHTLTFDGSADLNVLRIPLQFQYKYPAKKLQPKIALGFDFYMVKSAGFQELTHALCLNTGFNYKIGDKISLCASYNADFTPLVYVLTSDGGTHFSLVSDAIDIGFYIEF